MFNRKNIFKSYMFFHCHLGFSGEKNLQTHRDHKMVPTFELKFPVVHCGYEACYESIFVPKRSKTNHRSLTASLPLKRSVVFQDEPASYWVSANC